MKQFEEISFDHIIQENNQLVDALATLSFMFALSEDEDMPHTKIQCCGKPAYCHLVEEELDGKPWYYDIKKYIKSREYSPSDLENDKRTLRRLLMNFFLNWDVLYKRNHDMVLLRCIDIVEVQRNIREVHKGSFGTHSSGQAMARKILRASYYRLTMKANCFCYLRKFHKSQMYADNINVPRTS